MGSRANAVVIEGGKRHVYYSHWAAQFMDALAFWGPEHLLLEVRGWRDGLEDNPSWDGEWWLDNVWAEGGCCIDMDNRRLLVYGGEDIQCDVLWLETYLRLLPYTWSGWEVKWAWGELGEIARYAGVEGDKLEEIDCKVTCCPEGKRLDEYVSQIFDIPEWHLPGSSTLSVCKDGKVCASFLDETNPENLLLIGSKIDDAIARLGDETLVYDDGDFLMGGLHLNFDAGEATLWRTWGNCNEIVLPEYWGAWTLHDYHSDYRGFYHSVPHFIEFSVRSELVYIERVCNWLRKTAMRGYPHGMKAEEQERILSDVIRRYHEDNPSPRGLPGLWH